MEPFASLSTGMAKALLSAPWRKSVRHERKSPGNEDLNAISSMSETSHYIPAKLFAGFGLS
jgi:hypothetical protein